MDTYQLFKDIIMLKKTILIFFLFSSCAIASPTHVVTTTEGGSAKLGMFVRIHSNHNYHIRNDTASLKDFKMGMTLCPVDKPELCVVYLDHITLKPGQEFNFSKSLYQDVLYRGTGEHSVVAASSIDGITVSSDQKYIWIHY